MLKIDLNNLIKTLKSITQIFVLMFFILFGNQMVSQIIVESGTLSASFGVDADIQTDGTWRIYDGFGNLENPDSGPSDDWFMNSPLFSKIPPGQGVIDASYSPPAGNVEWDPRVGMSHDPLYVDPNTGTRWLDAVFFRDTHWAGSAEDLNVFKTGSNKNADNPQTWNIQSGNGGQKNDIIDVMGHIRRETADFGSDLWLFFGANTRSPDGSAYIDLELYREELTYSPNTGLGYSGPHGGHTAWIFNGSGDITSLGDVIISLNFENGGVNILGHIYLWVKPSLLPGGSIELANSVLNGNANIKFRFVIDGNGQPVFESGVGADGWGYAEIELKNPVETIAFASINGEDGSLNPNVSGDTPTGPWETRTGPQGIFVDYYPEDTFVEFGMNLTEIGLDQTIVIGAECEALFGGAFVKTRSSHSFTSELKDTAGPFDFGSLPPISVSIDGEDLDCGSEPDPAILTAVPLIDCELCEYQWYSGDPQTDGVEIPEENAIVLEVTTPGLYGVKMTAPGLNGPGTGCVSYAIFEVGELEPDPIVVECPENDELAACSTEEEIDAALEVWFTGFSFSGGENPTAVYTENGEEIDIDTYELPDFDPCIGGTVTITLTVTDECEQEESCSSTFTVLTDDEDPTASNPEPVNVECIEDVPEPDIEVVTDEDDNCDDPVVAHEGDESDGNTCPEIITRTYSVTDACDNQILVYQTITVDDVTDPTASDPEPVNVECIEDVPEPDIEVVTDEDDNCDAGVTVAHVGDESDGNTCPEVITRTYSVTDACDNQILVYQTITVDDVTDPEIFNLPDPEDLCNDEFPSELWAEWSDNCSEGGPISSGEPVITGFECYQEAVYTFYVEDDCENSDTETVTIIREFDLFENCETAFGRLSPEEQCFIDDEDYDFNRWGWTNYIAEESEVPYIMPLYAGAAHCDINNGALVGEVEVLYLNGEVNVTYHIDLGYAMSEAHVYIGCDKYPIDSNGNPTVAPGQYNFNLGALDNVNDYTLGPVEIEGPFYIIAHAVVCEATCRCSDPNTGGGVGSDEDPIICANDPGPTLTAQVDFRAYPVPFDGIVNIEYTFDYDTKISIEVFDIRGMLVKRLDDSYYSNGTIGTSRIDLEGTSNQIYFIRLMTDRGVSIKKVVTSHSAKKK